MEARGIEPLTNPLRKPRLLNRAAHKDLAAQLAGGGTIAEAAKVAGVDERTVYKWKADDPAFGQRVAELRAQMVSSALGRLSDAMARAADVLTDLLAHIDANVRLRAARGIIELGLRVRAEVELEQRLAAVEAALGSNDNGGSDRGAAEAGREECGEEASAAEA